jgi:hypothetical protein
VQCAAVLILLLTRCIIVAGACDVAWSVPAVPPQVLRHSFALGRGQVQVTRRHPPGTEAALCRSAGASTFLNNNKNDFHIRKMSYRYHTEIYLNKYSTGQRMFLKITNVFKADDTRELYETMKILFFIRV